MTREEAIRKLQMRKAEYLDEWVDFSGIAEAYDMAIEALSADAAQPTIEERKRGEWMPSDTDGFVCSACRNGYRNQPTLMGKPMFEFCPVCGADMREEGEK